MADFVRVPPDGAGKKVETTAVPVGAETYYRQRVEPVPLDANNTFNEASITAGNSAVVVSFAAPIGWKFQGILGGGEADGTYTVVFGLDKKYVSRTNIARRQADFILPNPDPTAGGQTVSVTVTNNGSATANFEVTLLGVQ